MCGIAGILDCQQTRKIGKDRLIAVRDEMLHRGPDEEGIYIDQHVGLAHRRLAIIDVKSGQQPFTNEQGNIALTYNGEIYNYKEIRSELRNAGHEFKTDSDTEVVLHAWMQWGESCVDRLRGMFAFAIWDRPANTLFIARDRLGIKPVYYGISQDGYLVFASELKALLKHPGFNREINEDAVVNFFTFGYVPEPDSIYAGINKLQAGHTITCKDGQLKSPQQYWDVPFHSSPVALDYEDAQKELLERLAEAVRIRMVAEVPLGAFLSGGVDSSAIVALMSAEQERAVSTCSIGFDSDAFDESSFSERVAKRYAADHEHVQVSANDEQTVDRIASVYDEPFADSSAVPTLKVCELARSRVTVSLSGDGADELLVGYRRQRMHMNEEQLRSNLPLSVRRPVFGTLGKLYPKADWAPKFLRAKTTFQALGNDSITAYLNSVAMVSQRARQQIFSDQFQQRANMRSAIDLFEWHAARCPSNDPMHVMQYLDIKTYLVDDILTKVDRASMAHSLEVRVPFLDHHLLEWLVNLPGEYKYKKGEGKAILKKSLEHKLPKDLLYRSKMGFSVPRNEWLSSSLKSRLHGALSSEKLFDTGIFDRTRLSRMLQQHESGHADHGTTLWSVLMFSDFLENQS